MSCFWANLNSSVTRLTIHLSITTAIIPNRISDAVAVRNDGVHESVICGGGVWLSSAKAARRWDYGPVRVGIGLLLPL